MFQQLGAQLNGLSGLLLHNGRLSDPLDSHARALKEVTSKRSKVEADFEEMSRLEFFGSLYTNEQNRIIMPGVCIEACILGGAKKNRLGTETKCGVMVEKDSLLIYDGPQNPDELWKDKRFVSRVSCVVNGNRVMRTRPLFTNWSLETVISYDDEVIGLAQVQQALVKAGRLVGLCDWRPKYGRFEVGFAE